MKKILSIAAIVTFVALSLGIGSIYAQEKDKKPIVTAEDEHAKIAQKHKEFIQRINLVNQDKALKDKADSKTIDKEGILLRGPSPAQPKVKTPIVKPPVISPQPQNTPSGVSMTTASPDNKAETNAVITRTFSISVEGVLYKPGDAYGEEITHVLKDVDGNVVCLIKDTERVLPPYGSYVIITASESQKAQNSQLFVLSGITDVKDEYGNDFILKSNERDEQYPRAPLIEYEYGKVASLTIFGSDGKPAYRYAYGADGKIKYTVNYDEDTRPGDEFLLKAPLIEYKDGKVASLTIFGSDGKPAQKYTFDENGRIVENVRYGAGNDINGDGKINELDVEAVRSHTGAVIGNPLYNENADLNHDGRITGTDVVLLRNVINEKNLRMPAKESYEGDTPGKLSVIAEPEKISENIPVIEKPAYVKPDLPVSDKSINPGDPNPPVIVLPKLPESKKPVVGALTTGATELPIKEPAKSPLVSLPVNDKPGSSVSATISVVSEVNDKMDVLEAAKTDLPPGVSISNQMVTKKDAQQPAAKSK